MKNAQKRRLTLASWMCLSPWPVQVSNYLGRRASKLGRSTTKLPKTCQEANGAWRQRTSKLMMSFNKGPPLGTLRILLGHPLPEMVLRMEVTSFARTSKTFLDVQTLFGCPKNALGVQTLFERPKHLFAMNIRKTVFCHERPNFFRTFMAKTFSHVHGKKMFGRS